MSMPNETTSTWHSQHSHHWNGTGNGTWGGGHGFNHHRSWGRTHAGPVLAVIISGLIVIGSLAVVIRTGVSMYRSRKVDNGEEEGVQDRKDGKGSARWLRQMLVIALLLSDAVIALSSIGPAAMGLTDKPLRGPECNPPGLILAFSLWWQYGFSLAIALTTYISLRHPLSRLKMQAERRGPVIIGVILGVGIIQGILWRFLHGYSGWRGFCFYGPPISLPSELIQFLPRLITSVLIISIYIPLIHFLHRPDLSSSFYATPINPSPSTFQNALTSSTSEDIPPWERLSIPDLNTFEKGAGAVVAVGMGLGYPAFGSAGGLEVVIRQREGGGFAMPDDRGLGEHRGSEVSEVSEMTLVPSQEGEKAEVHNDIDDGNLEDDEVRDELVDPKDTHRSCISENDPIKSLDEVPRGIIAHPKKARLRPSTASSTVTFSLPPSHPTETEDDDPNLEVSSFRGMLDYPMSSSSSFRSSRTVPFSRPVTPDCATWRVESMATFMNKKTSSLLLWFPLTHLVICANTIIRFVYYQVSKRAGPELEAVTLLVVMGQGVADVIVFGFVERRTQLRYQQEVAACTPGPVMSQRGT